MVPAFWPFLPTCLGTLHYLLVTRRLGGQVADDILDVEASSEELGKTAGKDEAVDKTTYPKLLGLERSKEVRPIGHGCESDCVWLNASRHLPASPQVARELVAEAKAALAPYGNAAAPLNGLADYIIDRKN